MLISIQWHKIGVEFFFEKETLKSQTAACFWYAFVFAGILTSTKMIHANYQRYSNYTTVMQSREIPVQIDNPEMLNYPTITLCSQSLREDQNLSFKEYSTL